MIYLIISASSAIGGALVSCDINPVLCVAISTDMSETRFSKGDVVPDWVLTTVPPVKVTFGIDAVVRVGDAGCEIAPAHRFRDDGDALLVTDPSLVTDQPVNIIGTHGLHFYSSPFYMHRRERLVRNRHITGLLLVKGK